MIENSELVTSYFGYWPEFADAKVARLCLSDRGEILLDLIYIDAEQGKAATIALQFNGIADVELTDFMTHNLLDQLSIEGDSPLVVGIAACYGLSGSFKCASAQVTELRPNNSFKPKPLRGSA
jgi:hypothetical protein